eukprot:5814117-Pleurochrysis_carterae.AAC.1
MVRGWKPGTGDWGWRGGSGSVMGGCTRVEKGSSRRLGSAKAGIAPGAVNAAGTSARLSGRTRSAKARAGSWWGSLRRA